MSTTIFPTICPHCGDVIEFHVNANADVPPSAGDVSMCFMCERPSVYGAGPFGLALRKPTAGELDELAEELAAGRDVFRQIKRAAGMEP